MADKINSFTQTVNDLIKQSNISLEFAVKTNESLTTQSDTIQLQVENKDAITGDPSIVTYSIPSYNSMINKVNSALQTMDTFVKGKGKVLLKDGTYREVKTIPVAVSPPKIEEVGTPTIFSTRNNWFFEELMFPQLTVSFDLKDKIDDRSDRVSVRRIIFDNYNEEETQWFKDNILSQDMTYYDTIVKLTENNKRYWQDDQIRDLPLSTEPYTGEFLIIDKRTIEGKEWYYLDTINFGVPSDEPIIKNIELQKGNYLRYNNAIYKINDINVEEKRVHLSIITGIERPSISYSFDIYSPPFAEKITDIPIGYNECNILFLKGINDDYNLLSDKWSNSISFYTNDLILENNTINLDEFYNQYVSDFGKFLEGQAKEKFIPAFFGVKPDAPELQEDALEVVEINTQVNAAINKDEIKNTQTQIESTKTIINSLKSTIAQQKAELVTITDTAQREDLNSKISINIEDLSKRTVEYQSLVKSLSTLAYENDVVNKTPKYRVRGFFNIPRGKKNFSESKTEKIQEVIQFEIGYRYLKLDNTGSELKSYRNTDPSSGDTKKGVFTDWNIVTTPIKERKYDKNSNQYIWVSPDIADGDVANINQVDVPIRKGEKVELKIRSISEAGWPMNPLKSDWSDTLLIEFPPNLTSSDQVTNILNDAIEEETNIKLQETLSASGVNTHIADSIPNPNAGDGTYFKHQAVNLAFDLPIKDKNGVVESVSTTDLQSQIANLSPYTYVTLSKPSGSSNSYDQLTGTLQKLFQAMVNIDPSIYDEFEQLINDPI